MLGVLAGCPPPTTIGVAPASTADALRFELRDLSGEPTRHSTHTLRVIELGGAEGPTAQRVVWEIESDRETGTRLSEVAFGVVPHGFRVRVPAKPLRAGRRYHATAGGASVSFVVGADGTLAEFPLGGGDRFTEGGMTIDGMETFTTRLRDAVNREDTAVLRQLVRFPLLLDSLDGNTPHTVSDSTFAEGAWQELFSPDVRLMLQYAEPDDFVVTLRGAVLGPGTIWVGPDCTAGEPEPCTPRIFEIWRRAP